MIYGYIRVSTDRQDSEGQKIGIIEKARTLDLIIQSWIADDGVSGTKEPDERLLGKLLKKIRSGDVIITSELSRLGRNLFMVMRILEHCMKIGAKVYTVKDGYELGDNIQSKVLAFAFSLAAEIERDMISKRTIEGLARCRANGGVLGRPMGSKSSCKLDPFEAKIRGYLAKDIPYSTIAKLLKVHRLTVRKICKDRGWDVNQPKSRPRTNYTPPSNFVCPVTDDALIEMYGRLYSFQKVSDELNVKPTALANYCKRAGLYETLQAMNAAQRIKVPSKTRQQ